MARLLLLALPCATVLLTAQTVSPSFEAASVRVNGSGDPSRSVRALSGGRFEATNAPLRNLIRFAYELRTLGEIEGGPDWMDTTAFDIRATGPAEASVPRMVQTLLEARFKLVVRRDVRERPVYALTVARPDGKLGRSLKIGTADVAPRQKSGPTQLEITNHPISRLVASLGALLGQTVIDRTGLTGTYDITLSFSSEQLPGVPGPGRPDPNLPSIFTAVQEQLGLKLEATRGPVSVLVVERAEMPTAD
jgi:uncharacterized protein (TIGR03435 family)